MYIVRDIKTKQIIHINPAPLSIELDGTDVYYQYNSETMEIGKTELTVLPEYFIIDDQKIIRELSVEEQVNQGIIQLGADQKIVDNQIVEMTISEKINNGLISLAPTQKVIGNGSEERIVDKTPSELVADKLINLSPSQKIIGEGESERIVNKSLEELVNEGIVKLASNQRIENGQVVTLTNEEMLAEGLIDLGEYKNRKIEEFSDMSFRLRVDILPEYKIVNASMGVYSEIEIENIKATITAFRDEFYNLKRQVEEANDVQEIAGIEENYPRQMVNAGV